jgi:DNA (cytosine-5)-methyltransferase 1
MALYWRYLSDPTPETRAAILSSEEWQAALHENGQRPLTLGVEADDTYVEARLNDAGLGEDDPWVLIGGPPCQAYSLVGRARMRGKDPIAFGRDHRHVLYREYLRIIRLFRPAIFVMENVKGLLSSTHEGDLILKRILEDLRRGGMDSGTDDLYQIRSLTVPTEEVGPAQLVVRSEFYGVPQARHRVFLLGIHRSLVRSLAAREKASRWSSFLLEPSTPTEDDWLSTKQAIGDLPTLVVRSSQTSSGAREDPEVRAAFAAAVRAARNDNVARTARYNRSAATAMVAALRETPRKSRRTDGSCSPALTNLYEILSTECVLQRVGHIPNHEARGHMPSDLARYLYASSWAKVHGSSPTLGEYPRPLLPNHANVRAGVREAVFTDRFRVQIAHRPATTITSHISKDGHYFIHYDPSQHRSLSVREAARLQTFPDDYYFEGPRTEQYHQVGNAVPPLLAEQIGKIVATLLRVAG